MGGIWAIILAAGESKRMGFPKMLLEFNGRSMIENVIGNVLSSDIDQTMVVLGAGRELLKELIIKYPVRYCYNDKYEDGMLSSVNCGFRNLPPDPDAVLVFQGDQPLITPDVTNKVIKAFRKSGKGIVIPVCENQRGHPLLVAGKYRCEIFKLEKSEGLRSLAYKFPEDIQEVETHDPRILRDFDTYEDYLNGINQTH
jgi:molybdenum cofactor cytidylyltransferase